MKEYKFEIVEMVLFILIMTWFKIPLGVVVINLIVWVWVRTAFHYIEISVYFGEVIR